MGAALSAFNELPQQKLFLFFCGEQSKISINIYMCIASFFFLPKSIFSLFLHTHTKKKQHMLWILNECTLTVFYNDKNFCKV